MVQVEMMSDRCRLVLSGELTIYHAADLKAALLTSLDNIEQPVEMDLSAVTELDTAGLQLLLAVAKQYEGKLAAASADSQELIKLYGLAAGFGGAVEEAA